MRTALTLAAAALAVGMTVFTPAPAEAGGDDSLPHWAPFRRDYVLHRHVHAKPRYRSVRKHYGLRRHPHHAYWVYCRRWSWREYCRPYRLSGYFVKNPDYRRMWIYR